MYGIRKEKHKELDFVTYSSSKFRPSFWGIIEKVYTDKTYRVRIIHPEKGITTILDGLESKTLKKESMNLGIKILKKIGMSKVDLKLLGYIIFQEGYKVLK